MRSQKSNSAVEISVADASLQPAIREATSLLRRYRLSYEQAQYVLKVARKSVGLERPRAPKRLSKALSSEEIERLFTAIRRSGKGEHELMYKLFLVTGLRCAEMCNLLRSDVHLTEGTIFVRQGKGSKDRVVPFPTSLRLPLDLHLKSTQEQHWLFETRQKRRFSTRWIQALSKEYGEAAGLSGFTVHVLRHCFCTNLSRGVKSADGSRVKLSDAQIQVISGHSQRSSLEIYTQLGLGSVRDDYETIMRESD